MNIIPNVKLLECSSIRTAIYAGLVCTDSEDKIENYTNDFIKNLIYTCCDCVWFYHLKIIHFLNKKVFTFKTGYV